MRRLFDLNNPLWRLMATLSDMMILTFLWLIFSLPIVTIGPATTAISNVALKMNAQGDNNVMKEFIISFKANFKKSFILGNVMIILLTILVVDIWYYYAVEQKFATLLLFMFILFSLLWYSIAIYIFPIIAYFDLGNIPALKVAFFMALRYFRWTLFLVTVNSALIFVTAIVAPYIVFFIIGGIAYLNTKVMHMLFSNECIQQKDGEVFFV